MLRSSTAEDVGLCYVQSAPSPTSTQLSQCYVLSCRLKILFGLAGLRAAELHGNLTQAMRLQALETFRQQEADYLICTDVAARGLDIQGVETVINFDCPKVRDMRCG